MSEFTVEGFAGGYFAILYLALTYVSGQFYGIFVDILLYAFVRLYGIFLAQTYEYYLHCSDDGKVLKIQWSRYILSSLFIIPQGDSRLRCTSISAMQVHR